MAEKNMGQKTKAVISFTHSNYCIRSAGTERYTRSLSRIMQDRGYTHLNFFSFYDDRKLLSNRVGVNVNDRFVGIYPYQYILGVINYIGYTRKLEYVAVHLQHLLHHDFAAVERVVASLKLPTVLMFHDFYLMCSKIKLIDTEGHFCGIAEPSKAKCGKCGYKDEAIQHFGLVQEFMKKIDPYISFCVTPSDFVTNHLKVIFNDYADRFVTRPHVLAYGDCNDPPVEHRIRIAFAGAQSRNKGYDDWKEVVGHLEQTAPGEYEFFYLGKGSEVCDGVKNVYVSTAEQGENAMVEHARRCKIDCAFVWPLIPETYSYVYYELSAGGAYILSNRNSGNISDAINKNGNGQVFEGIDDLLTWLSEPSRVREAINRYRVNHGFHPEGLVDNPDLSVLLPEGKGYTCDQARKTKPNFGWSISYRIKYKKMLSAQNR